MTSERKSALKLTVNFVILFLAMQGWGNCMVTQPSSLKAANDDTKAYHASQIPGIQVFTKVPPSKFLDCENSICQKIDLSNSVSAVVLSIECNCYSNNAFRILAGRDLSNDGNLAIEETDVRFGWDAGEWIFDLLRDDCVQLSLPANSTDPRQRVQVRFDVNENGNCTNVGFAANGQPLVPSGQLEKFKEVHVLDWNLLRIVRNGVPEPDEITSMNVFVR